jgi:HEAT repeat protein
MTRNAFDPLVKALGDESYIVRAGAAEALEGA